jgi:hypothetical protein
VVPFRAAGVRADRERLWSVVSLVAVLAVFASLRAQIVDVCRGRLLEVPEPDGWRALPEIPSKPGGSRLGDRFAFRSTTATPGADPGSRGLTLYDPEFCASSGVALARWFEAEPLRDDHRVPNELHLRESATTGILIVSGQAWAGPATPEQQLHLASFRREPGFRFTFVSPAARSAGLSLVVASVATLFAAVNARRAPRAARLGLTLSLAACVFALVLLMNEVLGEASGALR